MPFAIERGVTVTAEPARRFTVDALDLGEQDEFDEPERAEGWRAFPRGMVAELRAAGFDVAPAHLTITGDVPQGSGLSSSAALEAALALALLGRVPDDLRRTRAAVLARGERLGRRGDGPARPVGVAVLRARRTCCGSTSARSTSIPHPLDLGDWQLVTVDSGATHSIAASGLQRAPRRVPRRVRGARHHDAPRRDDGPARRRAGAARPARRERERPRGGHGRERSTPTTSRPSPACSTSPTPRCATTTRRPCPRSKPPWSA